MTDFDAVIDRSGTGSLKWAKYRDRDVIPAWVADMDIAAPPVVLEAIRQRLAHPILGYERPGDAFYAAVQGYLERYHGWQVRREAILPVPGLVPTLNWCCRMAGAEGDAILVPAPIYPPFLSAPVDQGRRAVRLPHVLDGDRWRMDLEAWAAEVPADARALLLCHPHNPLGRDWRRDELEALVAFCRERDLLLISDEIHCQLRLDDDGDFVSPATLNDWARCHTVTLLAPSKTYNIPGLSCALAIIEDADLRRRFERASAGCIPEITPLSVAAATAAYDHGEPWRAELLVWLRRNRDRVADHLRRWPRVHAAHVEATYLMWLDVRQLGLEDPHAACEAAGVGLHDGRLFGAPGFLRLNYATPLPLLEDILQRLDAVFG